MFRSLKKRSRASSRSVWDKTPSFADIKRDNVACLHVQLFPCSRLLSRLFSKDIVIRTGGASYPSWCRLLSVYFLCSVSLFTVPVQHLCPESLLSISLQYLCSISAYSMPVTSYSASSTAFFNTSSATSALSSTTAVFFSWLASALVTPSRVSRAFFTAFSQCPHIIPSI